MLEKMYLDGRLPSNGIKQQKIVNDGGVITTIGYAGGYIYENSSLKFANHPEGYIEPDGGGGYNYVYQYKDHLGNIRLSYADSNGDGIVESSEIRSEKNYYPFGLTHQGYNNQIQGTYHPYGFGEKEEQSELDLEWLDFSARNYDAALGRWMNIDPLAEKMYENSLYNYALNNPILFFDPDGALPWPIHIRSFISSPTTGGGLFAGDGRDADLDTSKNTTSRVESILTVDPAQGTVTDPQTEQGLTTFFGIPRTPFGRASDRGTPSGNVENTRNSKSNGGDRTSFEFSHSGKDPLTPSVVTPELDVHADLSITENLEEGTLDIKGSFTGDSFPSTEAFIVDQSGKTKLFLGARKEEGGVHSLVGDNKNHLFIVNMTVNIDKNGNFTGVTRNGTTYSVQEWNKFVQKRFNKFKD